MIIGIEVWAFVGFILAAYAVVGNDALQTLGTFIGSNRNLHWTILFAFAAIVLVATFAYGWHINAGDPSYGRLANTDKYPAIKIEWYHTLPPLVLLIITRLGIPVSTSFMVLTIFASVGGLGSMLGKSLIGYAAAFGIGAVLYLILSQTLERWFRSNSLNSSAPFGLISLVGIGFLASQHYVFGTIENANVFYTGVAFILTIEAIAFLLSARSGKQYYWVTAQWVTTAYLWGVWLVQDFANIFVFLPRELTAVQGFTGLAVILVLLGITFANRGGPVQRILSTKSNITDIRSATIIDFTYASLLFYFKEMSNIPMSTTWVFLGLIAGREYAFALTTKAMKLGLTVIDTAEDVAKAFVGIVISIDLAVGLPYIAKSVAGEPVIWGEIIPSGSFGIFVAIANIALLPAMFFALSKPDGDFGNSKLTWALAIIIMLLTLAAAFFTFPIGG